MTKVEITKIPLLNSVVIKQTGGHAFIAAKDSFIIDKEGLLRLIEELANVGFITEEDISQLSARIGLGNENKENSSNSS